MTTILSFPLELRPALPTVYGSLEYRRLEQQLRRIDELLQLSGVEQRFIHLSLEAYDQEAKRQGVELREGELQRHALRSQQAVRCEVLRRLLGESFRGMSCRLAQCALFQWFCYLGEVDRAKVPSKSALQQYAHWLTEEQLRELIGILLRAASEGSEGRPALGLAQDLELDTVWMDTFCVKANIHFPVDWVLLRDAVRTLMKAVKLIRNHGLRHRMPDPASFLSRINALAMEMSGVRRKADSHKERKRVLRQMKELLGVVARHARRYRQLLDQDWSKTDWSRKQAEQVLRRLDGVLEQLPQAIHQAHERIIGERRVPNQEKILSLYEPQVQVMVRGKAQAEVEFGNKMFLGEQAQGLVVDWFLEKEGVSSDTALVQPFLERIRSRLPKVILGAVGADRGFASAANSELLQQEGLYDGICPRSPKELQRRRQDPRFVRIQKRRAQTEARIGIFQNVFLGTPFRAKGFEHRELAVAWCVLAHNLWVLARLPIAEENRKCLKKAA